MTISLKFNPTFPFDYTVTRSNRRTLVIYVKSGKVDVRAPRNSPKVWIEAFLREKTSWILRQLQDQQEKLTQKLVIADNRQVDIFGRPRTVRVILSSRQKVEINQDYLFIFTRVNSPAKLEQIFNRWLLERAREYMSTQTIKTARRLRVEHKLKDVVFRKTRTKWGHCCHDGTIQYNWLTMMAPQPVVDYLIAHETSHLLYMDHSPRFWQTVARICPDYKALKDWLGNNGHRFWTAD